MKINRKGITLIEVTISIFIVSFILISMMRLYSLGRIQLVIARHKMMAINWAQAEIENLKNIGFEDIELANYPFRKTVIIDTGESDTSTNDDIDGEMLIEISNINEGYKVIITVTWDDYYGEISEVLESSIASYL